MSADILPRSEVHMTRVDRISTCIEYQYIANLIGRLSLGAGPSWFGAIARAHQSQNTDTLKKIMNLIAESG